MSIKLVDSAVPMNESGYPVARAKHIWFDDDATLQEKFDNKELGGGDSSVTLTQEEYEALTEEEKLDGLYYTYDTKRIYKNGVQYGASEPIPLTMEEYKALKAAGAIDAKQEYLVEADAEGILLGAEDIGYNNAESGIQATTVQGAVDKVAEKVDSKAEIDDTSSSTTSTYSSAKIDEKYDDKLFGYTSGDYALEIQLDDRKIDIEIVDNCGGKIELFGNGAIDTSVKYRFIKVLRLSYGNWTEFNATKPNDTYTKIKEVYVDTTNKKAYVHLKGNANYIVKGAKSVISKNYADVDTSTMTLIPESNWGSISDSSTSENSTWSSSKIVSEITSTFLIKEIAAGGDNEKTFSFKIRKDYFASYYAKRTFLLSANIYSLGFSKPVICLVEIFRGSADNYDGYIVNLQDTRFTGVTVTVNGDYLEVVVTLNSYESSGCKVSCSSLSNVPIA